MSAFALAPACALTLFHLASSVTLALTFTRTSSPQLVEPVRVADREGQLDIDTTGVCELVWSNNHAWMSSKVLSYQLQLAPKVNTQMRKFRSAVISAADDYRVLAAAEAADQLDRSMRTLKQRTAQLSQEMSASKEKAAVAAARHERYLTHVKKLEEEVAAAKAHADRGLPPPGEDEESDISGYGHHATHAELERRRALEQGDRELLYLFGGAALIGIACCALKQRSRRMPWQKPQKLQDKCAV